MLKRLIEKWKQYRYRLVPWIALNMNERTIRAVPTKTADAIIPQSEAIGSLEKIFQAFEESTYVKQSKEQSPSHLEKVHHQSLGVLQNTFGFTVERRPSNLIGGGVGVFVTTGEVPPNTVVALYPGTLYYNYEPILLQSLSNPFIFRCIDGLLIDGNDKRISKYIYKSCSNRDRIGPYLICDTSWLTPFPVNPLNIGQYVNNQSKAHEANVAYQEVDIPQDFPFHLRKYIPNIYYGANLDSMDVNRLTRVVILVSTRTITSGEELFSTYFTVLY
ncbi:hypothetical protein LOTGIDRAFT_126320 [Lottia gigantea]|uniref:SET domain-containing protein n=1 Tax=Lottia gigantea TaxID=225164 RepID=V3ZB95_LOTGI|nr:hypothetical protein LOTGIDRAFT_126320 [Lottia gigantea]ESO88293.1 hypothetical protein LOTGIDRAFT_126320 [Lottia gigantea]